MVKQSTSFPSFLMEPVDEVARKLLGCLLVRELDGEIITVRIVETESYDQDDAASHAYGGMRKRNAVMFGEAGHLYVYFTYGMHYCCNVVSGVEGYGSGVLIRAVEPIGGLEIIEKQRSKQGPDASNGPAKLTQALAIDLSMNGHDLKTAPIKLLNGGLEKGESIQTSPRIGISKSVELERRFFITGNRYVSRISSKTYSTDVR